MILLYKLYLVFWLAVLALFVRGHIKDVKVAKTEHSKNINHEFYSYLYLCLLVAGFIGLIGGDVL